MVPDEVRLLAQETNVNIYQLRYMSALHTELNVDELAALEAARLVCIKIADNKI